MRTCKPSFTPFEGENGMGWHVLGIWVQQKTWKMRNQHGDQFPWTQNDSWMECFNTQHFFAFKFLKFHILTMGCCCNVLHENSKDCLWWLWFVSYSEIATSIPINMLIM
jgi:hypothetical protein